MGEVDIGIGVLGPLQVHVGGVPVSVPGRRCPVVLASLALSAGRAVSTQALIEDVWGDQLPQSAAASLHNLVTRLRRVVGASAIRTVPAGYVLEIDPGRVDVLRFRRLAHEAAQVDDMEKAHSILEEALNLWRGDPLAGLASERLQHDAAPGLTEERLAATERRIQLDLSLRYDDRLIAELRQLVSRYPVRETLWYQLIVALDDAGRHADALNAYQELRAELRRHLGVEPSGRMRDLYQRLLTDQAPRPSVSAPHPARAQPDRPPPAERPARRPDSGRNDLPGDIADFTGRSPELDRLLALAAPDDERPRTVTITAIDGMAGIGKTTLQYFRKGILGEFVA